MTYSNGYDRTVTGSRFQIGDLTVHADRNGGGWTVYAWAGDAWSVADRRDCRACAAASVWRAFVAALAASQQQQRRRGSIEDPPRSMCRRLHSVAEPIHT